MRVERKGMADVDDLEIGENNRAQSATQLVLGLGNTSTTLLRVGTGGGASIGVYGEGGTGIHERAEWPLRHTIVVFTSDNGGGRFSKIWRFTGMKGNLLEGGLRIPAIARWPGRIPAGAVSEQVKLAAI
jgi:hypothetical protein